MGARPITVEAELTDEDRALIRGLCERIDWFMEHVAPSEGLLTTGQAAELAGVTRNTIHSWVHRGTLEVARREGNRRLFRREDVLRIGEPE